MSTDSLTNTEPDVDPSQLAVPFQFDDGNIIIRTGGIDFRVHKFILSHASTMFKDMFSLPCDCTDSQDGLPLVEVAEDAQTIHDVLSLLYPTIKDPDLDDLDVLGRVAPAIRKYDMQELQSRIATRLRTDVLHNALSIFAIACKGGLKDVARVAAYNTLTSSFASLISEDNHELIQLHGGTIFKLLRYHKKCGEVASRRVSYGETRRVNTKGAYDNILGHQYDYNGRRACPITDHLGTARNAYGQSLSCLSWWDDYIRHFEDECSSRPLGHDYTNPQVIRRFCKYTVTCKETCVHQATVVLLRLGKVLEKEVPEAVMTVSLDLDESDFLF